MANDNEYRPARYFYTRDLSRTFRAAEALEYGMVGINKGTIATEAALRRREGIGCRPPGGLKASKITRTPYIYASAGSSPYPDGRSRESPGSA